jgi:hypothetical protein
MARSTNPDTPERIDMQPVEPGDIIERFDGQLARIARRGSDQNGKHCLFIKFNGTTHRLESDRFDHWELKWTGKEYEA